MPIREFLLTNNQSSRRVGIGALTLVAFLLAVLGGCGKMLVRKDPALKPIQEMLEQKVPPGTPRANVSFYLASQGYSEEAAEKPGTLVATIRKIDTEKMEPVTAKVTFYFDANGKLNTFELQRTINQPTP